MDNIEIGPKTSSTAPVALGCLAAGIILGLIFSYLVPLIFKKPANKPVEVNQSMIPIRSGSLSDLSLLPIDPATASAVKNASILYTIQGNVKSSSPASLNGKNGFELEIFDPKGQIINHKFFISDKSIDVVTLDKQGKENKYSAAKIKTGDPVLLNWFVDLKDQSKNQVTKVFILTK